MQGSRRVNECAAVAGEQPPADVIESGAERGIDLVPLGNEPSPIDAYVMNSFGATEPEPATGPFLDRQPNLKIIIYQGQSLEPQDYTSYADIEELRSRNLPLATTPAGDPVAEGTFALLHATDLNLPTMIMNGSPATDRRGLAGTNLGIIGLGQIGTRVAEIAAAYGMTVNYASRRAHPSTERRLGLTRYPIAEIFERSDFISVHVANSAPRSLIGHAELGRAQDAILINTTSAPKVVDPAALVAALSSGRIRKAAVEGNYPNPWQRKLEELGPHRYLGIPACSTWDTPRTPAHSWDLVIEAIIATVTGGKINYRLI